MDSPERGRTRGAVTMVLTDAEGVIIALCPGLESLTGRSATEVVGSPLAMLLHPEQPTGLATWLSAELTAGLMAASYQHLANRHGGSVWLMSLACTWPSGTVHVGFVPHLEDRQLQAQRMYRTATEAERRALEAGLSRDAATTLGAQSLLKSLNELGFADYADLVFSALPTEVAGRPQVTGQVEGRLAPVWELAIRLHQLLGEARDRYNKLYEASQVMVAAAQTIEEQAEPMNQAAGQAVSSAVEQEGATATLLTAAHRMRAAAGEATVKLRTLTNGVLRAHGLIIGQRRALAGLAVVSEAVLEALRLALVDDQLAETEASSAGKPTLDPRFYEALAASLIAQLQTFAMETARTGAALTRLTKEAIEAAGQLRHFASSVESWRLLVSRFELDGWLWPSDLDINTTAGQIDGLRDLARDASGRVGVLDAAAIAEAAAVAGRALRGHLPRPPAMPAPTPPPTRAKPAWL